MTRYDSDIAVVGGGPTGLAAAIEASRRGLTVELFEPKAGPIDKACGEGLMPGAVESLRALGVDIPTGQPFFGVTYRDALDPTIVAHGTFPGPPGRGVRRVSLHESMLKCARGERINQINQKVTSISLHEEYAVVNGYHSTRWVIGADGLHSDVRRLVGLESAPNGASRFGIRRHYRRAPWTDRVEVHWSNAAEAYVTPIAGDTVGVAILFDPPGRFDPLLEHFPLLQKRLDGAEIVTEDRGAGAFGTKARAVRKGRVLLAGDAAGYVDALTGEGIALGIKVAREAVRCIHEGEVDTYEKHYASLTRRWNWSTKALLAMTRPRWVQRPLIRVLRAVPTLFDSSLSLLAGHTKSGDHA